MFLKLYNPITIAEQDSICDTCRLAAYEYIFERDLDRNGNIVSNGIHCNGIEMQVDDFPSTEMLRWFFNRTRVLDGEIVEEAASEKPLLSFAEGRPVTYNLHYDSNMGTRAVVGTIGVTGSKIETDTVICHERRKR